MDTLIMAPEKSVTAFVGIYKNNHWFIKKTNLCFK
jgi:hypothetical protein